MTTQEILEAARSGKTARWAFPRAEVRRDSALLGHGRGASAPLPAMQAILEANADRPGSRQRDTSREVMLDRLALTPERIERHGKGHPGSG